MEKEKKVKKFNPDPPETWHKRPILASVMGKCDCETEKPRKGDCVSCKNDFNCDIQIKSGEYDFQGCVKHQK